MKVIVMSLNFMKRFYYYEITKVDMAAKRRKNHKIKFKGKMIND
jgi:hypothetical protein